VAVVRDALSEARIALDSELRAVRVAVLRYARTENEAFGRSLAELVAAWKDEEN